MNLETLRLVRQPLWRQVNEELDLIQNPAIAELADVFTEFEEEMEFIAYYQYDQSTRQGEGSPARVVG